jgi:hypothetical protein
MLKFSGYDEGDINNILQLYTTYWSDFINQQKKGIKSFFKYVSTRIE